MMLISHLCNEIEEDSQLMYGSRVLRHAITDLKISMDAIIDDSLVTIISGHLMARDKKSPGAASESSCDPVVEALSILGRLRKSA